MINLAEQIDLPHRIVQSPEFADLSDYAEELNSKPDAPIKGLIRDLVTRAFTKYGMLEHEFMAIFRNGFATSLAADFIKNIQAPTENIENPLTPEDPQFQEAKAKLLKFLNRYEKSIASLYQNLQKLKKQYPDLKVIDLFDSELKALLVEKINETAAHISKKTFREEFGADAEEFMKEYIFPRLISRKNTEVIANTGNIKKFIEFLNENEILDEHVIHNELYRWFLGTEDQTETSTDSIRGAVDANLPQDSNGFPRENEADFDKVWTRFFEPVIADARAAEMSDEPDFDEFTSTNQRGMEKVISAPTIKKAVWKFLLAKPEHRAPLLRHYTSNNDRETLAKDLGQAKDFIEWSFNEFFADTDQNDPVRKEYDFTKEIMASDNVEELLQWSIRPVYLLRKLPKERQEALIKKHGRSNVLKVLSHEAGTVLKYMIIVRKCANIRDVQNRIKDRDAIRDFFIEFLEMGELTEEKIKTISFRVKENPNGSNGNRYDFITDEKSLQDRPAEKNTGEDGSVLHEIENKKFYQTTVTIPTHEGPKTIPVYFYANENEQLFHDKDLFSIISNFLREGKKHPDFTDLVRTSIIPVNPADYEDLRKYFARNFMTDGKKTTRFTEEKEQNENSAFPAHNRENMSGYAFVGKDQTRMNFEITVVQNLKDFLLYSVSDNTESSYKKYRAKREAPVIDHILHPAVVYGSQTYRKREKIAARQTARKIVMNSGSFKTSAR
ncbi:MAG: hypothetical protein WC843_00605 [Candidatus Gracilibacteria bacterium]|jgi:hypothetical protein